MVLQADKVEDAILNPPSHTATRETHTHVVTDGARHHHRHTRDGLEVHIAVHYQICVTLETQRQPPEHSL